MSKDRRRKSIFEEFFKPFEELDRIFERDLFSEIESMPGGYSIQVTQIGGRTVVKVKAGRGVDVGKLKERLRMQYPGAEIIVEGGKPLIEEVKEEEK